MRFTFIGLLFFAAVVLSKRTFTYDDKTFLKDGEPFRYVSGSFHYYRTHPDYWEDTFRKMVYQGMNAVQTYIPWSVHEPRPNEYDFSGYFDLFRWLDLAAKYNMSVIIRPGPFTCGEWESGGIPYWIYKEGDLGYRSSDPKFLMYVDAWYDYLYPLLVPYSYGQGGPIIMLQVSNEYGSLDICDHNYIRHLYHKAVEYFGDNLLPFTTDGGSDHMLECGGIDEMFRTVDFGCGGADGSFAVLRKYQKTGPLVNSEFYPGWIDAYFESHHRVSSDAVVESLETMLGKYNASVNFYMYLGGTNWGYYAGAAGITGEKGSYHPLTTSYDYDAPLSECRDMTDKYTRIREVLQKYFKIPEIEVHNTTKKDYGTIQFKESASLFENLDVLDPNPTVLRYPVEMEMLDVDFGYMLYRTTIKESGTLNIPDYQDRAMVYLNGKHLKTMMMMNSEDNTVKIELDKESTLDILIENQARVTNGRMNYKGLKANVTLNDVVLENWTHYKLRLQDLSKLKFTEDKDVPGDDTPYFYRSTFEVDEVADTFINPLGWNKGNIWINDFQIGRYWLVPPQLTLYCPGPILKKGTNQIIVLEQSRMHSENITMHAQDYPVLDYSG